MQSLRTWIELDTSAFEHNIALYHSQLTCNTLFAPVIKSNAYGHGFLNIAQLCQNNTHVDWLCTVSLSEALILRNNNITKPLLVLSILDDDLEAAIIHNIDLVLYDLDYAQKLNSLAQKLKKQVFVHIKIDTGLTRLGVLAKDALSFIQTIASLPFVTIRGIFSHFSNTENKEDPVSLGQLNIFNNILTLCKQNNITISLKHISCSAAITRYHESHYNFARAGIGIYGLWPSQDNKIVTQQHTPHFILKPVLTWKTHIIQVKTIPPATSIGYDCSFIAQRASTIAILPIGYYDGFDRKLSNKGHVLVNNTLAPIVGRNAMNLTMIDVTTIKNVHVGTKVTLLGNHFGLTADDIAQHIGTINYEVTTRIHENIPRIVTKSHS